MSISNKLLKSLKKENEVLLKNYKDFKKQKKVKLLQLEINKLNKQ